MDLPRIKEFWQNIPTTRKFQVWSAVSLLIVFAVLFPLLSQTIQDYYHDLNPQTLMEDVQDYTVDYLLKEDFQNYQQEKPKTRFEEFDQELKKRNIDFLQVWDRTGTIIYSDDDSKVGQQFQNNERWKQAMLSIAVIDIDDNITETGLEQRILMFVPALYKGETRPRGVIEIHQSVTTLDGALYETRQRLVLFFFISLVIIYVALNALYMEAQKGMEQAIKHLQEINEKKNDFISITAHELKTPIAVVSGASEMLFKDKKRIPKKHQGYLDMIQREVIRMNTLITEMLDISRIDLHTVEFVYDEVDVREFLTENIDGLTPMLKGKKLELKLKIGKNVDKAKIDRDRVWQIILNILMNAVKFSPDEKDIILGVKQAGEMLQFSVRDHGPGIPEEFQEKIFDRLYQVDKAKTRRHGGLGLGLAICKGFIEGMGGRIWVESTPGKGATFYFTIPLEGD